MWMVAWSLFYWCAFTMNIGCATANVWILLKNRKLVREMKRDVAKLQTHSQEMFECVRLVAWLAQPESNAPTALQEQCRKILPSWCEVSVEKLNASTAVH